MTHLLPSREARSLAVCGALLFLAGVLQGAGVQAFANPRLALSAHLDAVQSGMAVMIAAMLWSACGWSAMVERVARWSLAAGMVGLWLGLTLAAMTGASQALPMAGKGFSAPALAETVIGALVMLSSLALTLGWALFVLGLIRKR